MMLQRYEINVVRYARVKERDPGPGCPQALEKQDLFINSTSARPGRDIPWKMFSHGMVAHHGAFLNMDTPRVSPILV